MSLGYSIAISVVPFLDLLDNEEDSLSAQVLEATDEAAGGAAIDASRRRLAQGVDNVVRSLPAAARGDQGIARAVAYTLVGLTDERMLHHPAGGLDRWRERLLEFELYGSALAGQEIVNRARASAFGAPGSASGAEGNDPALLAPLYLAIFRSGFEGSLRGDTVGVASLTASLGEAVGATRMLESGLVSDDRPVRTGVSPLPVAIIGIVFWLAGGLALWWTLPRSALTDAWQIAERIDAGISAASAGEELLDRSVGPSGLPVIDTGSNANGSGS